VSKFSWYRRKYCAVDNKNMFSLLSPVIATHGNDSFSLPAFCMKRTLFTFGKFPPFLAPTPPPPAQFARVCTVEREREREEQVAYPSQRQALPFLLLLPLLRIKQLDARAKNQSWPDRICMKLNEEEKDFVCFPPSSGSLFSARCKSNLAPVRLLPARGYK
jgi:hypothetical protein